MPKLPDKRNENLFVYVNGELLPRDEARISVFDSVVQGGDAVWEGIRVYSSGVFQLESHLDRLFASAHAMAFRGVPKRDEVKQALFTTLEKNGMRDETHVRLTLTRGEKVTSGMSPEFNQSGCSLIVLAEWKKPVYAEEGITLITSAIRRNNPQCVDSKIHHNNLINNILAKIEANLAGADDAVMLDLNGFVSETNATNIFMRSGDSLLTPRADSCLPGITRSVVMELARTEGIEMIERNISLTEIYNANEVFTTGSMGELTPVLAVDGRHIGDGKSGPMTRRLLRLYLEKAAKESVPLPF